jgi:hypothetical protein
VTGDREERNRVLGFPVDRHPNSRPAGKPRRLPPAAQPEDQPQPAQPEDQPQAAEPQRVLGFPTDWLDEFGGVLRPLLRRLRGPRDRG